MGNVANDKSNNHFFQFPDEDSQQKTLKRKIPSISPLVSSRTSHFSGRQKESIANNIIYSASQVPTSPPSSTGSSASSSTSNRLSSNALLQSAILSQDVDDQERFDLSKDSTLLQSTTNQEISASSGVSLNLSVSIDMCF